jgi:hypothetical protein
MRMYGLSPRHDAHTIGNSELSHVCRFTDDELRVLPAMVFVTFFF